MQRTLLYEQHVALGGRMVPFSGWELPVQYPTGPLTEHNAVRTAAGVFDIDHMGQFSLTGPDAHAFLQYVQVYDISQMQPWDAHYSLLCYEDGTLIDDIFLYRLPSGWMIAVNADNRAKDLAWLQAHSHGFQIELTDISDETYMLAVQGPKAAAILQRMTDTNLDAVAARTGLRAAVGGVEMLLGRTGYTGEDGFELYLPADAALTFWKDLLAAGKDDGLLPCGLAARDSLRFEVCMPLYGHEIDATINPYEARQGWTVSLDKPDFLGRAALLKAKLEANQKILVGFEMIDRAVARDHYEIAVDGQVVGHVTTGMKSPTLDKFLGLGYVPPAYQKLGTEIDILVRGTPKRAKVVRRPFYKPRYKE
ncbi:MAG: glycine cleavage system aminomethyltransferase GcvT [Caldilineaceae bacterium]|nr:glycine cleavage system aminomethyltransferase GcvT [Caldilineaceae bacterium]